VGGPAPTAGLVHGVPESRPSLGLAAPPRAAERPLLLLAGFARHDLEALRQQLGGRHELLFAPGSEEAKRLLASRRIAVACLGERCTGEEARRLIAQQPAPAPWGNAAPPSGHSGASGDGAEPSGGGEPDLDPPLFLVLSAGPDTALFQELVAEDRIFYLTKSPPEPGALAALIDSALRLHQARRQARAGTREAAGPRGAVDALELLRLMAIESEPAGKAELLADGAREAVNAHRAYCLLYDPADDSLWARDATGSGERRESAAVGLASFALRSGMPVAVPRVGDDPRWDREADDPLGDGSERLLAVPACHHEGREGPGLRDGRGGSEERPVAVLIAVRRAADAMFSDAEREILERLAAAAAPYLPRPPAVDYDEPGEIFRREALEQYQHTDEQRDPLMLSPAWTRWTYWLLLSGLVGALVFSLLFEVHEYASGPAVVWMGGRTDVTATAAGTVRSVEVRAGQPVAAGQVLVRFDQAQEGAELARMEQEFELQLVKRLHDPADAAAEQALISLNAQLQLARARVRERTVTAPAAGVVADVRVRPGQYLSPGQALLAIVRGKADPEVLVMLPGEYRPQLTRGMPIRFEISGYRYAYQKLRLDAVDDEIVGPTEARRYLGPEIGDALTLNGPVVLLRAHLSGPAFRSEGKTYLYHNGMHGQAEVQVRSEKILVTLVPGLKPVFDRLHL
jgi:biotin carboxyl carrier protein